MIGELRISVILKRFLKNGISGGIGGLLVVALVVMGGLRGVYKVVNLLVRAGYNNRGVIRGG